MPLAVNDLVPVSNDHACVLHVYILDNRCDLRMSCHKCICKVLLGRKYRRCGDYDHHDLSGLSSDSYLQMPYEPGSCILVVYLQLERLYQFGKCSDDGRSLLILHITVLDWKYIVRPLLVHPGNYFSALLSPECRSDLIPVVIRILHAYYLVHRAKCSEQAIYILLFLGELLLVWNVHILTATAQMGYRAFAVWVGLIL